MTNEVLLTDDKIVIESENVKVKLKGKNSMLVMKARDVFVEMFNNHYVNIVENSTGVAPTELDTPLDPNFDRDTVENFLKYSSKIKIKKLAKTNESFTFS